MALIFKTDYLNNIISTKKYNVDRLIDESISLPYDWFDIKIKPNDLAVAHTINGSLEKLHNNLLYIIAKSKVPSNRIPLKSNYTHFISTTGALSASEWFARDQLSAILPDTTTNDYSKLVCGILVKNSLPSVNNAILASETNVMVLSAKSPRHSGTPGVSIYSNVSEMDNFTGRVFKKITSIAVNHDYDLFILDSYDKTISKYDISGLYFNDPAYLVKGTGIDGKLLTAVLGGAGSATDDNLFESPTCITTDNKNFLYVVDTSIDLVNNYIKKYDKNLNWIKSFNVTSELSERVPVDILYVQEVECFYVLSSDGYVLKYNRDFILQKSIQLTEIPSTEIYKKLVHSKENTNVVYVVTNKNIYKKYLTKLGQTLGKFLFTDRGLGLNDNNDFSFMSIVSGHDGDDVFVGDRANGSVYNFIETSQYEDSLYDNFQSQVIPFNNIKIKGDEYVNNIVYNKALGKLLYCHSSLVNNIKSKFVAEHDDTGKKVYKGLRFVLPREMSYYPFYPDIDNYIGINELVLAATINRTLKKIYDVQNNLISGSSAILQTETINVRPSVKLTTPVPLTPTPTPTPTATPIGATAPPSATPMPDPTATYAVGNGIWPSPTPEPTSTPTPSATPIFAWSDKYVAYDIYYPYIDNPTGPVPTPTPLKAYELAAYMGKGKDKGGMTYINTTIGSGSGGYMYNSAPIYISEEKVADNDSYNILYFDGSKWVINTWLSELPLDVDGSPFSASGISPRNTEWTYMQRVSGGDMRDSLIDGRLTPIGDYYFDEFTQTRIGYISEA